MFEQVRRHFSNAELVELTGVCGLFAQSNRFQDSLKLAIEPPHEVDKIRSSIRVDPARLKAYVERLVETWPDSFPSPVVGAPLSTPAIIPPAVAARRHAPRVPLLDFGDAAKDAGRFLDEARTLLGALPNWVRLWAHVPHLGKLFVPLPVALMREGAGAALPARLRAMALLATSVANAATYSSRHHVALSRAAGLTAAQLAALESGAAAAAPDFLPSESAAIEWARHVANNSAKDHDEVFGALRAHFGDAEIVELTALCALSSKLDRIHNALRLPLEAPEEFAALHRTESLDPARLRNYLKAIVDHWPAKLPAPAG